MRTIHFPDGQEVPVLGQGTWHMGEGDRPAAEEVRALQLGLDLGMTLIDTAEMYADGGAERVAGQAIAGRRDAVFLVSKVYPYNANRRTMRKSCEASLKRLGTDRLDLYLLHWPGSTPLHETAEEFEALKREGKILRWGVSNFDVDGMAELPGDGCATNQVLYNPDARGIEFDLLPWCATRHIPLMAYSPVGQGGELLDHPVLAAIATRHDATPAQVALAWAIRFPGTLAIPKATDPAHVRANAAAATLDLTQADLAEIDAAFPPPKRKQPLEML